MSQPRQVFQAKVSEILNSALFFLAYVMLYSPNIFAMLHTDFSIHFTT
jgi:hypothetical protein